MRRYVYSAAQIKKNISQIRDALKRINEEQEGINIFYAIKANRFRDIINLIRSEKDIGIYYSFLLFLFFLYLFI